ncbi:MAG: hypothetical protein NC307_07420 [Roseburia sp.]|nr:hypothetical protein [Roseburia sp.]
MLFVTVVRLLMSILPAKNGKNLKLPCGESTKEAVAALINQEVAAGKILYDGFMEPHRVKPSPNDRILLLPTYLLLFGDLGWITAIPRDKIYWLCPQIGYKGGPYYVRLLIFTENKLIDYDGNDIDHTIKTANDLYQYIPNVFSQYDPQELSHTLEHLFKENHEKFLEFYEQEKNLQ